MYHYSSPMCNCSLSLLYSCLKCTQYFTVVLLPFSHQFHTVHHLFLSLTPIVLAFSLSSLVAWYIGSVMVHSVSLPLHGLERGSMPPLLPPLSPSCLQTMLKDNHISSSFYPPPKENRKIGKYWTFSNIFLPKCCYYTEELRCTWTQQPLRCTLLSLDSIFLSSG